MNEHNVSVEAIKQVLDEFPDPETGRGMVRAGQVRGLHLKDGQLRVEIGLTSFAAPIWEKIGRQIREFLQGRFPQLSAIEVLVLEHYRPAEKVGPVGLAAKAVIAVGSGKGGVGKSTVAVFLAYGLHQAGCRVGLLDADVFGPSVPHLLGTRKEPFVERGKIQPIEVEGLKVMSMGLLVPPEEAVIWRGPMLHNALTQFLRDTDWGELDYLIIDMPPGTGDVAISLSQLLPLTGAVVVCTPQDVALLDATKAVTMFRRVNVEVLGMVENMSYFVCPACGARHEIFGSGGAQARAKELGIPFLGAIPINVQIRIHGDSGKTLACFAEPTIRAYVESISIRLVEIVVENRRRRPILPELTVL
jgi:ATP-binding protein involved in chromosome partitioning